MNFFRNSRSQPRDNIALPSRSPVFPFFFLDMQREFNYQQKSQSADLNKIVFSSKIHQRAGISPYGQKTG